MAYTRSIIAAQLSTPSEHRDLSYNLLNWVAWSLFVTEGSVQHRWTMTGDAKVLLARQNYYGSLSKEQYDCRLPGTVTYDRSTATFTMTYSHSAYVSSEYCASILLDSDVGYNAIANGDNMMLSWDGVSLLMVTTSTPLPPSISLVDRSYPMLSYIIKSLTCPLTHAHVSYVPYLCPSMVDCAAPAHQLRLPPPPLTRCSLTRCSLSSGTGCEQGRDLDEQPHHRQERAALPTGDAWMIGCVM